MMKFFAFSLLCSFFFFFLSFRLRSVLSEQVAASLPPRGWNSYDSFCWTISEGEFLQNAELVSQRLRQHGYEYVVVDYLWYRRKVPGAYVDSLGFDVIDEWGRMIPDPDRWPSSKNGKGFTEVAKKVHAMGLKFGVHIMRGISTQAYSANTPILDITTGKAYEESGRQWYAKDIGVKERSCAWMTNGFMSVDTKLGAAKAFLRSLHQQYADWGIDFVKHDCVFGDDFDFGEISTVSEILNRHTRRIIYSLSPGTSATPAMAKDISSLVNMYRITGDDWDSWADVAFHFDVTRDFSAANYTGAQGLNGKSWPDLDMLPLGWLTDPGSNEGPHRDSKLSLYEKRTQMTLWSMAKSPLMFGGDMRKLDETTHSIITNPTLMEINYYSSKNMEFPLSTSASKFSQEDRGMSFNARNLKEADKSESGVLGFLNCHDEEAKGWSVKSVDDNNLEQICWKEESRRKHQAPRCFYKRDSHLATDEAMAHKQKFLGKLHLLAMERMELCLGGSPRKKLTSKELMRGSFSHCRFDTNQMWELKNNGTLVNSYSGLCASMHTEKANSKSGGTRSWIANGRKGEIYVAFFNLNEEKTQISTKISDVAGALGAKVDEGSCSAQEVWSGKNVGIIKDDTLSAAVETHGCALFVLHCDFARQK